MVIAVYESSLYLVLNDLRACIFAYLVAECNSVHYHTVMHSAISPF